MHGLGCLGPEELSLQQSTQLTMALLVQEAAQVAQLAALGLRERVQLGN